MPNNICIYHKSCADGFGAALAVKVYFDEIGQDCKFVAAHYNDVPPDVTDMRVIIVDFSYPKEVLLDMHRKSASIVVLDHHKSAEEALDGLGFCLFDMNRSGAMMAWNYFHPNKEVPLLIKFIQDRDLWQWNLYKSKEFSAGLQLLEMSFKQWLPYLDDKRTTELIEKGEAILEYQEQQILRALNPEKIRMVEIGGFTVPILNTTTLISEICGRLSEGHPFAVTYFDTPTERVYSLRSREGGEDVSVIAKLFGGGGHAQAAGFSIDHAFSQL